MHILIKFMISKNDIKDCIIYKSFKEHSYVVTIDTAFDLIVIWKLFKYFSY